jgi:hypothetical protein
MGLPARSPTTNRVIVMNDVVPSSLWDVASGLVVLAHDADRGHAVSRHSSTR